MANPRAHVVPHGARQSEPFDHSGRSGSYFARQLARIKDAGMDLQEEIDARSREIDTDGYSMSINIALPLPDSVPLPSISNLCNGKPGSKP